MPAWFWFSLGLVLGFAAVPTLNTYLYLRDRSSEQKIDVLSVERRLSMIRQDAR